jgi:hypothetical protein
MLVALASRKSGLGDGMPQPFDMLSIIYLRVEIHTNSETLGAREMINDLCLTKKFFFRVPSPQRSPMYRKIDSITIIFMIISAHGGFALARDDSTD